MVEKMIDLVDALIPGDSEFPKASDVGVHGILAFRLRELEGASAYAHLMQVLGDNSGSAAVSSLESDHPALFESVRMISYLAYYEQPAVIHVIRTMGFVYNDSPLPLGYDLEPFDPVVDQPDVKGSYFSTEHFDQQGDNTL